MYNPGALLMPFWRHYGWALYMFQMSWHCAPLTMRGQFPSLVNPWEGNPNLSPIRKGAVLVSNHKTAGHSLQSVDQWSQSPICQPVQITVDWPIERLSSRDGTYVSVSCNVHNILFNISQYSTYKSPFPFNITISFQYHHFLSISPSHSQPFNSFPPPNYHYP